MGDFTITIDELDQIKDNAEELVAEIKASRSRLSAGGKKIVGREWLVIIGKASKLVTRLVAAMAS